MIFWTLIVLAALAIIITFIDNTWYEDWTFGILGAIIAVVISAVVGGGLFALAQLIPGDKRTEERFDLRAIGSSSTVQGRSYFLGSGYIEGRRTLNYIAQEDGYSRLGQGIASASRVYEDTDEPTVTEYTYWYSNPWVMPWEYERAHAWDFHVPSGSILENYEITNE